MNRLILLVAMLCACEPDDSKPREPEISDPFRPPPYPKPNLRGLHVYPSGDVVLVVEAIQ